MTKEMNEKTHDAKRHYSEARDSATSAVNSAKSAYHDLTDDGITEITAQLVENLKEFLSDRKKDVLSGGNKCKSHIKENPFSTVVGALLIGAVLGFLLRK